jgi:hypothetical protein
MASLAEQRCLHHPQREAVARCPACRQFFCRECVAEHSGRMVCAACLRKLLRGAEARRFRWQSLVGLGQALAGLLVAWLFFYSVGRLLLTIPESFHPGTFWSGRGEE